MTVTVERRSDAVWRRANDRVLLARTDGASVELLGAAAHAWLAIDRPCTIDDVQRVVAEAASVGAASPIAEEIERLLELGWLVVADGVS